VANTVLRRIAIWPSTMALGSVLPSWSNAYAARVADQVGASDRTMNRKEAV